MPNLERFRLRAFMEQLVEAGDCLVVDQNVDLVDVAGYLERASKAVWFKSVGPEKAELAGNVCSSRGRLALAFGVTPEQLPLRLREASAGLIRPIEVDQTVAPVQQVVRVGAEADFLSLPVHLQHELDGAPYISASIDFARDPTTGGTNIGVRRIMLRGAQDAGIDLIAPSDLRSIFQQNSAKGQRTEVAYVVGAHPADLIAGTASTRCDDEFELMGSLRGEAVPIVKCRTIDVKVPADAEYVLEGYFDPAGYTEPEGPYGEFLGYYGEVKTNPIFRLTAITHRHDALFQTATIGGRFMVRTDTAQLVAAKTEATLWGALQQAVREPKAVCCTPSCGGMFNVRVSLRQRYPGEARNAIAAIFGSVADVKHVFVVDDDVDVFDDGQIDWALATRFQADRDLIIASGFRAVPVDPSLAGSRTGAKAGFDCTRPIGGPRPFPQGVPQPPVMPERRFNSVAEALAQGPASFLELMSAAGTRDGREVLRDLEPLYARGVLARAPDGRYKLQAAASGAVKPK
jgi:2,5-furandicarboxylate decarboxylase 1